jgi:hypothetical protein
MSDRKQLFGNYKGKGVSRDREEENALMLEQQNDMRMQELDAKVSALKNVSFHYVKRVLYSLTSNPPWTLRLQLISTAMSLIRT